MSSQKESDDNGRPSYISPGADLIWKHADYYNSVTNDNLRYLLPEYPSSFLLARNIELELAGMDNKAVWHAMSEYCHKSSGGGFALVDRRLSQSMKVSKTANGIKIKIPGAHNIIISYYTVKLPRFPTRRLVRGVFLTIESSSS